MSFPESARRGGIMAALSQDHALGRVIVVAFIGWLIRHIVIAWICPLGATKSPP